MLRVAVKTDLGLYRIYDNGKVLLRPKGKKKWHKVTPEDRIFRGVGYKVRKSRKHLRLRAV